MLECHVNLEVVHWWFGALFFNMEQVRLRFWVNERMKKHTVKRWTNFWSNVLRIIYRLNISSPFSRTMRRFALLNIHVAGYVAIFPHNDFAYPLFRSSSYWKYLGLPCKRSLFGRSPVQFCGQIGMCDTGCFEHHHRLSASYTCESYASSLCVRSHTELFQN